MEHPKYGSKSCQVLVASGAVVLVLSACYLCAATGTSGSRASASWVWEIILPLGWPLGGVYVHCQASNPCQKGCQVRDNEKRKSARYSLCSRNVRCAEALLLEACTVALQEGAMKVL